MDAVALGGVDREAAPAGADVEHALAALEPELLADQLVLGLLRLLQRRRAAREDRARVGHRRAEEEPEELGRDVVVVAHRARVALARVEAPARRQLGRGRRGRAHDARGARRGDHQARLVPAVDRGRLPVVEQADHGVEVVDVERARDVGAAEAELAGRAQDVRERLRRAGGEGGSVGPGRGDLGAVPQRDGEGPVGERVGERRAKGGGIGHAFDASASWLDERAPLAVPAPQPVAGAQVHAAEPAVEAVERDAVGAAGEHLGARLGERELAAVTSGCGPRGELLEAVERDRVAEERRLLGRGRIEERLLARAGARGDGGQQLALGAREAVAGAGQLLAAAAAAPARRTAAARPARWPRARARAGRARGRRPRPRGRRARARRSRACAPATGSRARRARARRGRRSPGGRGTSRRRSARRPTGRSGSPARICSSWSWS